MNSHDEEHSNKDSLVEELEVRSNLAWCSEKEKKKEKYLLYFCFLRQHLQSL